MGILLLLTIFLPTTLVKAQLFKSQRQKTNANLTIAKDTVVNKKDTFGVKRDTATLYKDSIVYVRSLRMSKDSLDAAVDYNASDSGVMIIKTKEFFLY